MSKSAYLYVQGDVRLDGGVHLVGVVVPCTSLAKAVHQVNADKECGLKPGDIYIRYSKYAAALREIKRLKEQLESADTAAELELDRRWQGG